MRLDCLGMMRWTTVVLLSLTTLAPLSGCRSHDIPVEPPVHTWLKTELYFGLTRKDSSLITNEQWEKFLNEHIVRAFPSGLTILHGDGRWRDAQGVIHTEPSRILVLYYPATDESVDGKLRRIAEKYATEFDQEALLRSDVRERVEFIYPPTTRPTTLPATQP